MATKDPGTLAPEMTAVSQDILTFLNIPFGRAPRGKPLDLDAIFKGNISEDARELLRTTTSQRNKLMDLLTDPQVDSRNVIGAIDAYLPLLWRVTSCVQASGSDKIKLNKKLSFVWTSSLNKKGKEFSGEVFLFEVAFILTIRAIYHRNAAKLILERDADAFQDIGKELRTGAGIFSFVGNDLLKRWQQGPADSPLEADPLVHACLSALFLADAQRIAIAKALKSDTKPTLMAKLLVGAAEKYKFATRCIQKVSGASFDSIIPELLEELGAFPAILRGCASNCLAQTFWSKGEYAQGLAYAIDGAHRLEIISMGEGLKNSALQNALNEATVRAIKLRSEYQNDCNNVYFEKPSKDVRQPDATFIINAIPYELPPAKLLSFAEAPLPESQRTMPIQSFWTALWGSPTEEQDVSGASISGAAELPGVQELSLNSTTSPAKLSAPEGVDSSVFLSLPEDIQREIINDVTAGRPVNL